MQFLFQTNDGNHTPLIPINRQRLQFLLIQEITLYPTSEHRKTPTTNSRSKND